MIISGADTVKVNVYLKSGKVMTFGVEELEVKTSQLTGKIANLKWTANKEAKTKLIYAELDQIAGITTEE